MFIVLLYVRDKNHKVIQMFEDIPLSQVSIFNLMSIQGIFVLTQYSGYQLWVYKIWIPAIGRACYSTNLAFCRVSILEMATHFGVLAWRIPRKGEPGGLPSMGSHRVGHDWSDLAIAAAESPSYNTIVRGNCFSWNKSSFSFFFGKVRPQND